jgi:hypothetical protein
MYVIYPTDHIRYYSSSKDHHHHHQLSTMLKALRRRSGSRSESSTTNDEDPLATRSTINFFDLPGEIRNQIYELSAHNATLRIVENCSSRRTSKTSSSSSRVDPISPPGLLLVSKRCRQEYLPILLSTAHIEASITNFDFKNVMRVIGGLFPTELRALRANTNLVLSLLVPTSGSQNEFTNIRRWALSRANALDRLPWNYRLAPESLSAASSSIRRSCYYRMTFMFSAVEESLRWEMSHLINVVRGAGPGWS